MDCTYCGKGLPRSNRKRGRGTFTRSMEIGRIDPEMMFCTLRCAAKYGVWVARAVKEKAKKMPPMGA